jgi:hypothetical protein
MYLPSTADSSDFSTLTKYYENPQTDNSVHLVPTSFHVSKRGKAIPLQALRGPEGSRSFRLPDFKTIGTLKWQGCQPSAPAAFTPGNIPGTHFC